MIAYQKAEIIYDGTYYFCHKHFQKYDRTIDQMVQAARSGKQNIAEGSIASGTSKEMEIKLTNIARASLEELIIDYKDFLRTRKLTIWDKKLHYYPHLTKLHKTPDANYETYRKGIESPDPEVAANVLISLINITSYMLAKQLTRIFHTVSYRGRVSGRRYKARAVRATQTYLTICRGAKTSATQ